MDMVSYITFSFWLFSIVLLGCQESPGISNNIEGPGPHPIEQIADLVENEQGESVTIHLSEYYKSESPITSATFSSDSINIEPLNQDSFRFSQAKYVSGEFAIDGVVTNKDDYKLESQLTYKVKADPEIPPSDGILVIMPLGDSLTNDSRPRVTLWNLLTEDGHKLNYVGDQRQSSSIPDDQHEGVGGIKIEGIADKAARLMNSHQPEYIFLMVGTNNIAWYFDETPEVIAGRWNDLIQIIYDNSAPETYIIAATIPPVTSSIVGSSNMQERDRAVAVKRYNSALRDIISVRKSNGYNIILADVEEALSLAQHVADDGVHLNRDGYIKMGTIYYEAMNSALWEQHENR